MEFKDNTINFNQNVNGNNSGAMSLGIGRITSNNILSNSEKDDINNLMKELEEFIVKQKFEKEKEESILDDFDIIKEQIKDDNPKSVKIKKAYKGIESFFKEVTRILGGSVTILDKVERLHLMLKPWIEF